MRLYPSDHVYKVKPPVLGNDTSSDPFFVMLKGIAQDAFDEQVGEDARVKMEYSPEEALKRTTASTVKFIADRVVGFENLFVGDDEIKTFDECRKNAPREITNWLMMAIYSTEILTEAEIKN